MHWRHQPAALDETPRRSTIDREVIRVLAGERVPARRTRELETWLDVRIRED